MTHTEFCYWFQGFLELSKTTALDADQLDLVKKHLDLSFTKVTDKPKDLVTKAELRSSLKDHNCSPRKYC